MSGNRPSPFRPPQKRARKFNWASARLVTLGLALGGLAAVPLWHWLAGAKPPGDTFPCASVEIVDGDTFKCDGRRIRLQGIDAPELDGHCRPGRQCAPGDGNASKDSLSALVGNAAVQCRATDTDSYGRTVARCTAGDKDLSCAQLDAGQAIRRYAAISC